MGVIFADDKLDQSSHHWWAGIWKFIAFVIILSAVMLGFLNFNIQKSENHLQDGKNGAHVDRIVRLNEVQMTTLKHNNQENSVTNETQIIATKPLEEKISAIKSESHKSQLNGETYYLQQILSNPQDIDSYLVLLQLYENEGRTQDSERLLLSAIKNADDASEFQHLLLKQYLSQGQQQKADALIKKLRPKNIKNADFLAFLAMHYQRNNQAKDSIDLFKSALSLKPEESQWWLGLGLSFESLGQFKDARSAYVKASDAGAKVDTLLDSIAMKIKGQGK